MTRPVPATSPLAHRFARVRARGRAALCDTVLPIALAVLVAAFVADGHLRLRPARGGRRGQAGQSTVEYALILLAAASVALAVVAWVTRTDLIGRLFDTVVGRILEQAS
jgi:hypothetical protein